MRAYFSIVSFCGSNELKKLEVVCKRTNNSKEVQDIVAAIRQGLVGIKSAEQIAEVTAAITHLCNMTDSLTLQADVSASMLAT